MDIRLNAVCKSYGELRVLRDFSHRFAEDRAHCVFGASGCGKTTLLRLVAGLETPDSGVISGTKDRRIAMVFQENRLFESLSAERNVLLTARRGFTRADAHSLLNALGLSETDGKRVRDFSGGMKRRVAIARALAADYDLLLLDEPLSGLDGETRLQALQIIRAQAQGRTLICATHDPQDAKALNAECLHLP